MPPNFLTSPKNIEISGINYRISAKKVIHIRVVRSTLASFLNGPNGVNATYTKFLHLFV